MGVKGKKDRITVAIYKMVPEDKTLNEAIVFIPNSIEPDEQIQVGKFAKSFLRETYYEKSVGVSASKISEYDIERGDNG